MSLCRICGQANGIFTCRGCDQDFCIRHVNEHGHLLHERLNKIVLENDQLRENLKAKSDFQLLMEKIDEWEQGSIEKVQRTADDAREQLTEIFDKYSVDMTKILDLFTEELIEARQKHDLLEANLQAWSTKLEKIKKELDILPKIRIKRDYDKTPFIERILVMQTADELFEESVGNIRIQDNRKTITHGCLSAFGAARSKGAYAGGCHRFRFEINSSNTIGLVFLGVIPQSSSMKATSLIVPTAYGWTGENNTFPNETEGGRPWNYIKDMKTNDTFEMIVDCNRQTVWLKNERTEEEYELHIDLNVCPFPWQLYFCLSYWGNSIRFLSI